MKFVILIIMIGMVNCTSFVPKENLRAVPICNLNEFDLHESKLYSTDSKVYRLREKINEYKSTLSSLNYTGIISTEIESLKKNLLSRMDSIRISLAVSTEKVGNALGREYNFSKAIETYLDALEDAEEVIENKNEANPLIERLRKNISVSRENGENYLLNRIKSLVDQASYLYLDDQMDKAEEAMEVAKKEMEDSIFLNAKTIAIYTEQAKVMKLYDTSITPYCSANFFTENLSKERLDALKTKLPKSFQTKSGIKFEKILRKDGKPVYVSEVIRPQSMDSWYFARNYADKLNKEENCPHCYQLPEFADIENINVSGYYEGLWLKSWSLAPIGMTLGNLYLGAYTFDFLHDVIVHPLTWQSYVYPISPDGAYSRGGSWDGDARLIRSASRDYYAGRNHYDGFRLVRPLR